MPEAGFSFTLSYDFNGLEKGVSLDLGRVLGPRGIKCLKSVFFSGGRYLPGNIARLHKGWTGLDAVFTRIFNLPGGKEWSFKAELNLPANAIFLEARPSGASPEVLKNLAFAEVCGLKAMAAAHELSGMEYEGRAVWKKASAFCETSGQWAEEYELEATVPVVSGDRRAVGEKGRMGKAALLSCSVREDSATRRRRVMLRVDDGFSGERGRSGSVAMMEAARMWAVNRPGAGKSLKDVEIYVPPGFAAAGAKAAMERLALAVGGVRPFAIHQEAEMESCVFYYTGQEVERIGGLT